MRICGLWYDGKACFLVAFGAQEGPAVLPPPPLPFFSRVRESNLGMLTIGGSLKHSSPISVSLVGVAPRGPEDEHPPPPPSRGPCSDLNYTPSPNPSSASVSSFSFFSFFAYPSTLLLIILDFTSPSPSLSCFFALLLIIWIPLSNNSRHKSSQSSAEATFWNGKKERKSPEGPS